MSHNRVEKLESRVEELEASISGLTDELMETKSRLADLEDESTGEYIEAGVGSVAENGSGESTANEEANPVEDDSTDSDSSEADDIIVA
jgi:predicted  nucleic acid-binding Zn-ribbon protein